MIFFISLKVRTTFFFYNYDSRLIQRNEAKEGDQFTFSFFNDIL